MSDTDTISEEWLPAKAALHELAKTMQPRTAIAQLQEAARLGVVRTRARLAIVHPYYQGDGLEQRYDHHIVPTAWWTPDRVHHIQGRPPKINFDSGDYASVVSIDGTLMVVSLKMVSYDAKQMREYFDIASAAASPGREQEEQPARSKGGVIRDSEKWDAVTVAIARLANEGRLDRNLDGRFKTQADMRRAILDDPDVLALGVLDETLKPLARKVWNALLS